MPEFQLSGRNNTTFQALSEFEQGYVEAAFFADTPVYRTSSADKAKAWVDAYRIGYQWAVDARIR